MLRRCKGKNNKISFEYFMITKTKLNLYEYSIQELKTYLKSEKFIVSGNKKILVNRIEEYFNKIKSIITIQKYFRRYIVELYFNLITSGQHNYKGRCKLGLKLKSVNTGYNNIIAEKYVNDTDGFSLEPINEINNKIIFKYKDKIGYLYAFDIYSLYSAYLNMGKIINPYTREEFDYITTNNVLQLHRLIIILFPFIKNIKLKEEENKNHYIQPAIINNEQQRLTLKLTEIKNNSIMQRINNIFHEINSLGNYTTPDWFSFLEKFDYIKFYKCLHNYWNYRLDISCDTKQKVCQLYEPFYNTYYEFFSNTNYNNNTVEFYQDCCLTVMENWIHCGINLEYRKLGALHVLSVLTEVSIPARETLFYLHESLYNII